MHPPTPRATPADNPDRWYSQESLVGRLVRLEPLTYEHAAGYFHAAHADDGAAAVFRDLSVGIPSTVDAALAHIVAALAARARGDRLPFAQLDAVSGEFLGTTSYYDVAPSLRTLAIGHTWLGRRWWRTGHNTESKVLLLSHAFDTLGAARVVWHTDIRNARSQVAIERLGAVKEGVLRKHRIRPDGTWRDTVQYSMCDDDWPACGARLRARMEHTG
jgi:RimJ/RimL family protein N-acetyltransferase